MTRTEGATVTTVYVAMICDRHADPEPFVFSTPEAAIDYAKYCATANARDLQDFEESVIDGWLYHATYSVEGDGVWVLAREVDPVMAP